MQQDIGEVRRVLHLNHKILELYAARPMQQAWPRQELAEVCRSLPLTLKLYADSLVQQACLQQELAEVCRVKPSSAKAICCEPYASALVHQERAERFCAAGRDGGTSVEPRR